MNRLRIDAFEALYIAISIATFSHTMWASAFVFEGLPPSDTIGVLIWYGKGALIAVAVDVGMFTTSRSLITARGINIVFLIIAFLIASAGSFFTQLTFLLAHTPQYIISDAVSIEWIQRLQPTIDARVVLFPALLPGLAAVYTLARIFKHKDDVVQAKQLVDVSPIIIESPKHLVEVIKEQPQLLETTDRLSLPEGQKVDWERLTFWDSIENKWRGPYKSKSMLVSQMKTLETRRKRKAEKVKQKVKKNGKLSSEDMPLSLPEER